MPSPRFFGKIPWMVVVDNKARNIVYGDKVSNTIGNVRRWDFGSVDGDEEKFCVIAWEGGEVDDAAQVGEVIEDNRQLLEGVLYVFVSLVS